VDGVHENILYGTAVIRLMKRPVHTPLSPPPLDSDAFQNTRTPHSPHQHQYTRHVRPASGAWLTKTSETRTWRSLIIKPRDHHAVEESTNRQGVRYKFARGGGSRPAVSRHGKKIMSASVNQSVKCVRYSSTSARPTLHSYLPPPSPLLPTTTHTHRAHALSPCRLAFSVIRPGRRPTHLVIRNRQGWKTTQIQ
jgi:hypothetical protein